MESLFRAHAYNEKRWGVTPISDSLSKENHSQHHDENQSYKDDEGLLIVVQVATSLKRLVESLPALSSRYVRWL
jgi:hypothetical protein